MNYSKIYQDLIWKRKVYQRLDKTQAGENHHIVPLSEGGLDTKNNIVRLTIKEHIFAHQLLARIWNDSKMWYAANFMMSVQRKKIGKNKCLRLATIAREKYRLSMSNLMKGKKKPPRTEEHKRKLSESHKGQKPWNKGKQISEEQKRKISETLKGNTPWNKGKKGLQHLSEKRKREISESMKGNQYAKGNTPWNKGKQISEEQKRKISEAHKGLTPGNKGKHWHIGTDGKRHYS